MYPIYLWKNRFREVNWPKVTQKEAGAEPRMFNSIAYAFDYHTNLAPLLYLLKSQGPQVQNDDNDMLHRLS